MNIFISSFIPYCRIRAGYRLYTACPCQPTAHSRQRTASYVIEGRDASSRAHVALTPLPSCPASYAPAHHAPSSSPFHGAPIHGAAVATAPPPHTPSRRRPWRLSASDASLGRASAKPSQPFRNSGREASSAKASVQPLQILSATVADPQCNRCRSSVQLLQILSATVADPRYACRARPRSRRSPRRPSPSWDGPG